MAGWNDHNWVTDRLALGSAVSERSQVEVLVRDGVTHVLDCRIQGADLELYRGTGIRYQQHGTHDDGKSQPDEWFFRGLTFALDALGVPHTKVLVHCRFGMSRSPTMVYAILRAQGEAPEAALAKISKARLVARVTYREDAERAVRGWRRKKG
jgi:hypothetical protein